MKEFKSIEDILDFAMNEEQNAVEFYRELAENARSEDMRNIFTQFALEEVGHKERLMKIKKEGLFSLPAEKVADLRISDYIVTVATSPEMTYQDALVVAMKKEKAAFKLYLTLSEKAANSEMKSVFLSLAQEESKHKLRFELEYDEFVLRDN